VELALAYYLHLGTGFPWVALRLDDIIGAWALAYYLGQGTGFPWVALRLADVIGQCVGGGALLLPVPGPRLPLGSSEAG
jgi:hypothetical protein